MHREIYQYKKSRKKIEKLNKKVVNTGENLEKMAKALHIEPYKLDIFNLKKEPKELLEDMQFVLKNVSEDGIKLAYKILSGIFY